MKDTKTTGISDKVIDAIVALKKKGDQASDDSDKGVDLMSIVKKLSRNRERSAKNK